MYHLAYGRDVPITSWPDPDTVPCPRYGPTYPGHTGVDAYTAYDPYGSRVPLYAMSDGVVVAVSTPENPYNRYASYPSSGLSPAIRAGDMVWRIGHFAECVVSVGEWVHKGQHIGYQGWTGNVDPPGPNGTHSHTSVYFDPPGQATPTLVDPVPYCNGALDFPPCPKPEDTDMITIPAMLYEYISTSGRVRETPGLSGRDTGARVQTGDCIMVTALSAADGYVWAQIAAGWVAIAQGTDAWAVPAGTDTTGLERQIAALTSERDALALARDAAIGERDYKQAQLEQIKQIIG